MSHGSRYALVIGSTEFRDSKLCQLVTPIADGQEMARVLKDPAIGGFTVRRFLNQESSSLRLRLQKFLNSLIPDDTILLYFSGHGVLNDYGELFLATPDTQEKYPDSTSIPLKFICTMLDRSNAERKILVLDCCYSGTATRGIKGASETLWKPSVEELGKGTAILSASSARQVALEALESEKLKKGALSVFTRCLVEGLKTGNAAKEDKPYISVLDWFEYAERRMKEMGARQTPEQKLTGAQGSIIVARNVRYPRVTLPEQVVELLNSPLSADQRRAIGHLSELAAGENRDVAKLAIEALKRLSLSEHTQVQGKAKVALTGLGISPPRLPIRRKALSFFRALGHGVMDALNKKPWWFATLAVITLSLRIMSLRLSLFAAFTIGVLVAVLAFNSLIYFAYLMVEWSLGSKNTAQLEVGALTALVGIVCLAGFITFQTDSINQAMQSVSGLRIEGPLTEEPVTTAPPAEKHVPQPSTSWTETIEGFFTFEDRDDAVRILFTVFACLGGLVGLSTAKESRMLGILLGVTGGSIIGILMGSVVSAAMSFGDALQNAFP